MRRKGACPWNGLGEPSSVLQKEQRCPGLEQEERGAVRRSSVWTEPPTRLSHVGISQWDGKPPRGTGHSRGNTWSVFPVGKKKKLYLAARLRIDPEGSKYWSRKARGCWINPSRTWWCLNLGSQIEVVRNGWILDVFLKVQPTGWIDRSDTECGRKEGIPGNFKP